jgi:hypothetical protein
MTIQFDIPKPSSMLVGNLLGVLGLIAVVVAIGGLAGAWWAVLVGGVAAIGLSVVAATHAAAEQAAPARPGVAAAAPVRVAEEPAAA